MLALLSLCIMSLQATGIEEKMMNFESLLHRQAVKESAKKANVPPTRFADKKKQERFDYLLGRTEEIFEESDLVLHFDYYYGDKWALVERCAVYESKEEYFIAVLKNAIKQKTSYAEDFFLSRDEDRAVDHTLFVLVIEGTNPDRYHKYRKALGYTKERLERFPVENWNYYVLICEEYMDLFYTALEGFVESYDKGMDSWRAYLEENNWLALEMQYDYDYE